MWRALVKGGKGTSIFVPQFVQILTRIIFKGHSHARFPPHLGIFLAPQTKACGAPLFALGTPNWKVGGKGRGSSFYPFFHFLGFSSPPSIPTPPICSPRAGRGGGRRAVIES